MDEWGAGRYQPKTKLIEKLMIKTNKSKVIFIQEEYADGEGKYFYSDGASYEGKWKNGKRHGKGILTLSDGRKYFGKWNLGRNNDTGMIGA